MKTYILKKDLPWAKSGTEWHEVNRGSDIYMRQNGEDNERRWVRLLDMPYEAVDDWFEPKETRWMPKDGERYWFITLENDIEVDDYAWYGSKFDIDQHKIGNCFETEVQANVAANRVKATLLAYHKELAK